MLNRKYFNLFQLFVAGASEVGKTSLIHRFTDDYFTLNNINGIDFKLKIIKIKEKRIKLQIWDIVGCVSLRTLIIKKLPMNTNITGFLNLIKTLKIISQI